LRDRSQPLWAAASYDSIKRDRESGKRLLATELSHQWSGRACQGWWCNGCFRQLRIVGPTSCVRRVAVQPWSFNGLGCLGW